MIYKYFSRESFTWEKATGVIISGEREVPLGGSKSFLTYCVGAEKGRTVNVFPECIVKILRG